MSLPEERHHSGGTFICCLNHRLSEFFQPLRVGPLHELSRDAALRYAVDILERVDGALYYNPFILQVDVVIVNELSAVANKAYKSNHRPKDVYVSVF